MLSLFFRIPQYCNGNVELKINGQKVDGTFHPGTFAAVNRTWSDQDKIDITFPIALHLLPLSPENQDVVALKFGPLALFAITEEQLSFKKQDLLNAKRVKPDEWQIDLANKRSLSSLLLQLKKRSIRYMSKQSDVDLIPFGGEFCQV